MKRKQPDKCGCTLSQSVTGDGCAVCNPKLAAELEGIVSVASVQRFPCGRICRVMACDGINVKIRDPGVWCGLVTMRTFRKKWRVT